MSLILFFFIVLHAELFHGWCSNIFDIAPPTLRKIEHLLCSVFLLFVDEGLHNYVAFFCPLPYKFSSKFFEEVRSFVMCFFVVVL